MSAPEQPPGVGTYTTTSPVVVRAAQLTEDADWDAIATWCGGEHHVERDISDEYVSYLMVPGADDAGPAIASHGDWIIRGVTGLFFVKLPDEFAAIYRTAVDEQATPEQEARRVRGVVLDTLHRIIQEQGEISDDPDDIVSAAQTLWSALGVDAPAPRQVFREGDPKPDRPLTLLDREGDVAWHDPGDPDWDPYLRAYGPVVEIVIPDYAVAVAADEAARALPTSALGLPGGEPCAACLRKAAATVTFLHVAAPDRGGE